MMPTEDDPRWKIFDEAVREASPDRAVTLAAELPLTPLRTDGKTALHIAAIAGAFEAGRVLLERGADPMARDEGGWTPLRSAALAGSSELVAAMLPRCDDAREHAAALEDALGSFGRHRRVARTPSYGVETLRVLLDAGVDPMAKGLVHADRTLLEGAGSGLLSRRIDPAVHVEVLALFVDRGASLEEAFPSPVDDPLALVVRAYEDSPLETFLVDRGIPVAGRDGRATVLHGLAARGASRAVFESWIARGARLEARNAHGQTPLLVAASYAVRMSVEALVAIGADLHAVDDEGHNAHALAGERADGEALAAWLVERGVTPSSVEKGHASPRPAAIPPGVIHTKVVRGAFNGFEAHVTRTPDDRGRYRAVVIVFGRGVEMLLERDDLALGAD